MSEWLVYVDGGSRGNPGCAGVGVVVQPPAAQRTEISEWIGACDNNYAEYAGLAVALEYALMGDCRRLQAYSDSQVVVRQMTGYYKCQSPALRSIYEVCATLVSCLDSFAITHIGRERNHEANRLAQAAIAREQRQQGYAAGSRRLLEQAIARAAAQAANAAAFSLAEPLDASWLRP